MKILNSFDEWLVSKDQWPKQSHYASQINACMRQQYYDWVGAEKTNIPTPGNYLKMEMGKAIESVFEKWIIWAIKKKSVISGKYIIVGYNNQWKEKYSIDGLKYPITCKIDFILEIETSKKERHLVGVEVKSSFGQGIKNIYRTQEPKIDYLYQIYCYTALTPFKTFIHPYFGRDNGYRTEFFIKGYDYYLNVYGAWGAKKYDFDFNKLIAKLKHIELSIEKKILPARDYKAAIKNGEVKDKYQHHGIMYKSDWQCMYCDYRDLCWKKECMTYEYTNNSDMF